MFERDLIGVATRAKPGQVSIQLDDPLYNPDVQRFIMDIQATIDAAAHKARVQIGLKDAADWYVAGTSTWSQIQNQAISLCRETVNEMQAVTGERYDQIIARVRAATLKNQTTGATSAELVKELGQAFSEESRWRARRIARTESARGHNYGFMLGTQDEPEVEGYEWLLSSDACDKCKLIGLKDGEPARVKKGEPFTVVPGANPDYATIFAPPLHPNCMCTVTPVVETLAASVVSLKMPVPAGLLVAASEGKPEMHYTEMDIRLDGEIQEFEGYASKYYALDTYGTIAMPGAFDASLPEFLRRNIIGNIDHDHSKPIGKFYSATSDATGLYVKGRFSDVSWSKDVRTLIKDEVIKGLSVGMNIQESRQATAAEVKKIWAKAGYKPDENELRRLEERKGAILIAKARLREVSPTAMPSNEHSEIMAFKSEADDAGFLAKLKTLVFGHFGHEPKQETTAQPVTTVNPQAAKLKLQLALSRGQHAGKI